jgi:hypothetical protein
MNESEIEEHLRSMPPAAPSADFQRRIAEELSVPPAKPIFHWRAMFRQILPPCGWATAGAAATLVILAGSGRLQPSSNAAKLTPPIGEPLVAAFQPLPSSRQLVEAHDEGVLFSETGLPSRRVRASSVERHAWTNPATGARLEVEVPREDIILTSLSLQ